MVRLSQRSLVDKARALCRPPAFCVAFTDFRRASVAIVDPKHRVSDQAGKLRVAPLAITHHGNLYVASVEVVEDANRLTLGGEVGYRQRVDEVAVQSGADMGQQVFGVFAYEDVHCTGYTGLYDCCAISPVSVRIFCVCASL